MRRIVCSIAFFRQMLSVQLVFTSTKSRRTFCAQVERRSFHTVSALSGHGLVHCKCLLLIFRLIKDGRVNADVATYRFGPRLIGPPTTGKANNPPEEANAYAMKFLPIYDVICHAFAKELRNRDGKLRRCATSFQRGPACLFEYFRKLRRNWRTVFLRRFVDA